MNTGTPAEEMHQPVSGALPADIMAIVAQELRGPLTVVKGYTQRLMMSWETLDDKGKLAILGRINTSISRLHRLVDDITLVSGGLAGDFIMMARPYLLERVVQHSINEVGARRGDRATALIPAGEDVSMYGDEYRLEQVVITLLDLAIQRSPRESPINVSYGLVDEQARITITDSGASLQPEEWDALFGRTGTLATHGSIASGALSLELFLADGLVRAMGGSLRAESGESMTRIVLDVPVSRS